MVTLYKAKKVGGERIAMTEAEVAEHQEAQRVAHEEAEARRNHYTTKRRKEYPTWQDQLDDIYHNGINGWKATIKVTKDKYPKP